MEMKDRKFNEGQEFLIQGIVEAARVVLTTMGPMGNKVSVHSHRHFFTRDGVTVARHLQGGYRDVGTHPAWRIKNQGVQYLVDACDKTVKKGGDGTTTTAAVLSGLLEAYQKYGENVEVNQLVRDIKAIASRLIKILEDSSKKPDKATLMDLATVSANNNRDLGYMIGELVWELGIDSYIEPVFAMGEETSVEIKKGFEINQGFLVPQYINTPKNIFGVSHTQEGVVLRNPYVVIVEEEITDIQNQLLPFYRAYMSTIQQGPNGPFYPRPLLMFAGDVAGHALQVILNNLFDPEPGYPNAPVFVVKSPESGDRRYAMLKDIQAATGCRRIFSKHSGTSLKQFKGVQDLGSVQAVEITRELTRMVLDPAYDDAVKERIKKIENTEKDEQFKSMRIGKMTKGIGVIKIGGFTEAEYNSVSSVVEDCVLASQSAIKHGVLIGAGKALYDAFDKLDPEKYSSVALEIARIACSKPAMTILKNAGKASSEEDDSVLLHSTDSLYNVMTEDSELYSETEIFDAAEVIIGAVRNAVSLACEVIQTKYVIVE